MHTGLVVAGQHAGHQVEVGIVVKSDRDGAGLTGCYKQDHLAMVGLTGDSLVTVALVAGCHVLHCGVLGRESKLVIDHTIVGDLENDRLTLGNCHFCRAESELRHRHLRRAADLGAVIVMRGGVVAVGRGNACRYRRGNPVVTLPSYVLQSS